MEKRKSRKMETLRKPLQGVYNILRFNWHFYVLAIAVIIVLTCVGIYSPTFQPITLLIVILISFSTIISLLVSMYVYDFSNFYQLKWLKAEIDKKSNLLNIHAGFDESSALLQNKFPESSLQVFDFYNPILHTEVSIKRARKAYPEFPGTRQITTTSLPLADQSVDHIFLILAAHEIRNEAERILFFKELRRVLKANGSIIVVEHLRDTFNFLAYNIGFFHFLSASTWKSTFSKAGLATTTQSKITPFLTSYSLKK
jgi:ubiquinone/menaquinone biosynthesis C-methylase UbiE